MYFFNVEKNLSLPKKLNNTCMLSCFNFLFFITTFASCIMWLNSTFPTYLLTEKGNTILFNFLHEVSSPSSSQSLYLDNYYTHMSFRSHLLFYTLFVLLIFSFQLACYEFFAIFCVYYPFKTFVFFVFTTNLVCLCFVITYHFFRR